MPMAGGPEAGLPPPLHQQQKDVMESPTAAAAIGQRAGLGGRVASMTSLLGQTPPSAAAAAASAAAAAAAAATGTSLQNAGEGRMAHVAQALLSLLPHQVRPGSAPANGGAATAAASGTVDGIPLLPATRLLHLRWQGLAAASQTLGAPGGGGGEAHQVSEMVASMPFELRALEVVLEQTVSLLDAQTTELERATRMALDELTLRVNPRNLERMRHLKGRMAALSNKVDTVRGVLEKLLDDDRAMAAMNLTAKDEQQQQQAAVAAAQQLAAREREEWLQQGSGALPSPANPASSGSLFHHSLELQHGPLAGAPSSPAGIERITSQCAGGGGGGGNGPDTEEVAVVEMLLEAYFMQLGHSWQRLQSLKSYIDSTEDLINLELDQQRNNLISVDLMVTFGSFLLTAMSVIAGLFGMNVTNRMEGDYSAFLGICIGSASTAVVLWLLFVYCSIRYGLMNGLSMTWR
ncbi:hypothetical protein Vretifemale_3444 [Volvox reticuliferus]|nr:hypothetical protein Vretifemale_3444 [Volvox reticuliferus]